MLQKNDANGCFRSIRYTTIAVRRQGEKNHVHLSAPLNIEYLNIELSIFCAHEAELCLNMKRDKIHCETHLSRVY